MPLQDLKFWSLSARRAWIEIQKLLKSIDKYVSLSARRAWIEIIWIWSAENYGLVALRKESVDRNTAIKSNQRICISSLSARRAWIEILPGVYALDCAVCRSPQGERG